MKYLARSIIAALTLLCLAAPAMAQWQVPAHSVPIGRGPGVVGFHDALSSVEGQVLTSHNGSDPTWTTPAAGGSVTSVTCGTGLTGGTITTTGTCALSTPVSVSNGGTGLTSGTSGGVLSYTATGTLSSSGALTNHALVVGGGAGAAPGVVNSLGTTTTLLHGNAAANPTWAQVVYGDIDSTAISTAGNYQSNAASSLLGPNAVWSAAGTTALTDAGTIAVDFSTGINFTLTIAGNETLGAPSNAKSGQTGVIRVTQGSGGSHTLAYNGAYKFSGGTACTLSTAAAKIDYLFYWVFSSSEVLLNCVLNVSMLVAPANDNGLMAAVG